MLTKRKKMFSLSHWQQLYPYKTRAWNEKDTLLNHKLAKSFSIAIWKYHDFPKKFISASYISNSRNPS